MQHIVPNYIKFFHLKWMQQDKRFVEEKHDAQFILQMHNQYCFAIVHNREHNPSPRLFLFKKMILFQNINKTLSTNFIFILHWFMKIQQIYKYVLVVSKCNPRKLSFSTKAYIFNPFALTELCIFISDREKTIVSISYLVLQQMINSQVIQILDLPLSQSKEMIPPKNPRSTWSFIECSTHHSIGDSYGCTEWRELTAQIAQVIGSEQGDCIKVSQLSLDHLYSPWLCCVLMHTWFVYNCTPDLQVLAHVCHIEMVKFI